MAEGILKEAEEAANRAAERQFAQTAEQPEVKDSTPIEEPVKAEKPRRTSSRKQNKSETSDEKGKK